MVTIVLVVAGVILIGASHPIIGGICIEFAVLRIIS